MIYLTIMSNNQKEVQIFSRISSIPLVNSALIIVTDIYGRIKNYNHLLNATLSTTESSITYVATASPVTVVTKKLEKQISIADTLACNGLDTLEKKVPSIKKSPKEIKGEAMKRVIELKVYGINQMRVIRKVSLEKAYSVLEIPLISAIRENLVHFLDVFDQTLDNFLPPTEGKETDLQRKELLARVVFLPFKVRERLVFRYNKFVDSISRNK
jgi:perilipin-2